MSVLEDKKNFKLFEFFDKILEFESFKESDDKTYILLEDIYILTQFYKCQQTQTLFNQSQAINQIREKKERISSKRTYESIKSRYRFYLSKLQNNDLLNFVQFYEHLLDTNDLKRSQKSINADLIWQTRAILIYTKSPSKFEIHYQELKYQKESQFVFENFENKYEVIIDKLDKIIDRIAQKSNQKIDQQSQMQQQKQIRKKSAISSDFEECKEQPKKKSTLIKKKQCPNNDVKNKRDASQGVKGKQKQKNEQTFKVISEQKNKGKEEYFSDIENIHSDINEFSDNIDQYKSQKSQKWRVVSPSSSEERSTKHNKAIKFQKQYLKNFKKQELNESTIKKQDNINNLNNNKSEISFDNQFKSTEKIKNYEENPKEQDLKNVKIIKNIDKLSKKQMEEEKISEQSQQQIENINEMQQSSFNQDNKNFNKQQNSIIQEDIVNISNNNDSNNGQIRVTNKSLEDDFKMFQQFKPDLYEQNQYEIQSQSNNNDSQSEISTQDLRKVILKRNMYQSMNEFFEGDYKAPDQNHQKILSYIMTNQQPIEIIFRKVYNQINQEVEELQKKEEQWVNLFEFLKKEYGFSEERIINLLDHCSWDTQILFQYLSNFNQFMKPKQVLWNQNEDKILIEQFSKQSSIQLQNIYYEELSNKDQYTQQQRLNFYQCVKNSEN